MDKEVAYVCETKVIEPLTDEQRKIAIDRFKESELVCLSQVALETQTPFHAIRKLILEISRGRNLIYITYHQETGDYITKIRGLVNKNSKLLSCVVDNSFSVEELENPLLVEQDFIILYVGVDDFEEKFDLLKGRLDNTHLIKEVNDHTVLFFKESLGLTEALNATIDRINLRFDYVSNLKMHSFIDSYKKILKKTFHTLQERKSIPAHIKYDCGYEVVIADYIVEFFKENIESAVDFSIDNYLSQR